MARVTAPHTDPICSLNLVPGLGTCSGRPDLACRVLRASRHHVLCDWRPVQTPPGRTVSLFPGLLARSWSLPQPGAPCAHRNSAPGALSLIPPPPTDSLAPEHLLSLLNPCWLCPPSPACSHGRATSVTEDRQLCRTLGAP